MRPRALAGQMRGSELAPWPMRSPLTAFFWSANSKAAWEMRWMEASFKGADRAGWMVPSMVRWTCRNWKAWERASALVDCVHSAGRRSQ